MVRLTKLFTEFFESEKSAGVMGIMIGLIAGKLLGIFLLSMAGVALGWCALPADLKKRDIVGAGLLAGIGFTMSIFITHLAFISDTFIVSSKMASIIGSTILGIAGYALLRATLKLRNTNN